MSMMITRRSAVFGARAHSHSRAAAAAQDKIVLKMGTLGSVEYFYYKGAVRMAQEVAARERQGASRSRCSPISSSVTSAT